MCFRAFQKCSTSFKGVPGVIYGTSGLFQEVSKSFMNVQGGLRDVSECSSGFYERSKSFQCFQERSKGFQGRSKEFQMVPGALQGCSSGFRSVPWFVPATFQGYTAGFRSVIRVFQKFQEHSMGFQFQGVSRAFQGFSRGFRGVSEIAQVFQDLSQGISVDFRAFHERSRGF